jgi:hypothetical protein
LPDESPEAEPSLIGLGVTFGPPDLSATPTAGRAVRLLLPAARGVARLLPDGVLVATRWDALDGTVAGSTTAAGATSPIDPSATAPPVAPPSPPAAGEVPQDLVVAEAPGEVIAPIKATRLSSGGLAVAVRLPATPGLYRLVSMLHRPDGLAYDAATQALVPALIVRVVDPNAVAYQVEPSARVTTGHPLELAVGVTNLGLSAWGRAPTGRGAGPAELVLGGRATLVARWVPLAASDEAPDAGDTSVGLPPGLAPGTTATVAIGLIAPRSAGQYLVLLDVVDPDGASFAARGVPPAIVRVTVGS